MTTNSVFIIFPNQLFEDLSIIKSFNPKYVFLIEEPIFFYDKTYKPFKPHQIKIAYLRASMKAYYDLHLKNNFPRKTKYIDYKDLLQDNFNYDFIKTKNIEEIVFYDPLDVDLTSKLNKHFNNKVKLNVVHNPDLLLSQDVLNEYFNDKLKTPKHATFYEFVKMKLDVLKGIKNLDAMNRSPPPKEAPHIYQFSNSKNTNKYYTEAIAYTKSNFNHHFGDCELLKTYPITSLDAKKSFDNFLINSLENFGKYEDAVMTEDPFMYHSVISSLLNIGILSPTYVLNKTLDYYHKYKDVKNIPLSSLEGFIRQVIGWRFFMQSLYMYRHDELVMSNIPQNKLTFKNFHDWYEGNTGIKPIDEEIKKIKKYGYAHHIVRLMMLMNFFILCNVHPHEIYRWFMEVVSIDAYSWVMISNIYAMGYFYPKIMSKPYISSSNYIVKMTNYKKDGHWNVIWDALYHKFLRDKPSTYTFFYKRTYKNNENSHTIAQEFIDKHFIPYKGNQ
jgi:deoxyribodipyrimidine photolyase-related protein